MDLRRGDVWWTALDPAGGSEIGKTRPCVILSATALNQRRRTLVLLPLSTSATVRPPLTVSVEIAGRHSVAVIDQIKASAKERLQSRIGSLTAIEMEAIEEALQQVLGIH